MVERRIPGTNLAWRDLPFWLGGMALALAWGAPFVWMVSTSFKPSNQVMTKDIEWLPREITFANYAKVFEYPVLTWAMNSVIQATVTTALCVLFGAMAGYAIARLRFPVATCCSCCSCRRSWSRPRSRSCRCCWRSSRSAGPRAYRADPADDRQRVLGLHLPPVLPLLPEGAGGSGDRRRRRPVPDLLQDRAAAGARTGDRGGGDRVHAELEQLPLAAAGHL
ncbi:MAG: hypothetical protein U1E17_21790 [Geminicoccaceae bacterium]